MKLRVESRPYCVSFRRPLQTAHGLWCERRGVIARWRDEEGALHYAELAPLPHLRGKMGVPSLPFAAAPKPKTTSPREVAALLPAGRAALAVLRERRLMGDHDRSSYGFRVFKWKVGISPDPAEELDILEELCAELPEGGRVRLDANGGWTQRVAEQWLTRCAEPRLAARIEFIEQPVWAGAQADERDQRQTADVLLGLSADYPTLIALDESVASDEELRGWLERGWRGVYVVKPTLLAEPAVVLGELARAGARVVFSSAMETAVGAKAALRWAFAWEGREEERFALGFGVYPLFCDAVFEGPRAQPFFRWEDVQAINDEAVWSALV